MHRLPRQQRGENGGAGSENLYSATDLLHIAGMAKPPAPRKHASRAKAARPEVHPLDEHLAALLNPALNERPLGVSEQPQALYFSRERGMSGAAASADSLKDLLDKGDPNLRDKKPWTPHRPPRPGKS